MHYLKPLNDKHLIFQPGVIVIAGNEKSIVTRNDITMTAANVVVAAITQPNDQLVLPQEKNGTIARVRVRVHVQLGASVQLDTHLIMSIRVIVFPHI